MSYIVAFVCLSLRGAAYRFNCFRDDVSAGDEVLVRLGNGAYRPGTVEKIEYLDWKCDGAVVCKMTETVKKSSGLVPGPGVSPFRGLTNNRAMIQHLRTRGWVSLGHGANFKALCGYHNGTDRAHVWFTNRSIRLEIMDSAEPLPAEGAFAAATPCGPPAGDTPLLANHLQPLRGHREVRRGGRGEHGRLRAVL